MRPSTTTIELTQAEVRALVEVAAHEPDPALVSAHAKLKAVDLRTACASCKKKLGGVSLESAGLYYCLPCGRKAAVCSVCEGTGRLSLVAGGAPVITARKRDARECSQCNGTGITTAAVL